MVFADPSVEEAVRMRLGGGPIGPEQAAGVKVVDLYDPRRLWDLRCFPALETILVRASASDPGPPIDVTGIGGLTGLELLSISDLHITDTAPLGELEGLSKLFLWNVGNIDTTFLVRLADLEELTLSKSTLSDLSPLGSLTKLTHLSLAEVGLDQIPPLSKVAPLRELDLNSNRIVDPSPITALPFLGGVFLRRNAITDLTALAASPATYWQLDLEENPIDCNAQRHNLEILRDKGATTDCWF
jgi:hypothetical protein